MGDSRIRLCGLILRDGTDGRPSLLESPFFSHRKVGFQTASAIIKSRDNIVFCSTLFLKQHPVDRVLIVTLDAANLSFGVPCLRPFGLRILGKINIVVDDNLFRSESIVSFSFELGRKETRMNGSNHYQH